MPSCLRTCIWIMSAVWWMVSSSRSSPMPRCTPPRPKPITGWTRRRWLKLRRRPKASSRSRRTPPHLTSLRGASKPSPRVSRLCRVWSRPNWRPDTRRAAALTASPPRGKASCSWGTWCTTSPCNSCTRRCRSGSTSTISKRSRVAIRCSAPLPRARPG
ncbi:hypothetical protein D9M73_226590 [compost metagenome]